MWEDKGISVVTSPFGFTSILSNLDFDSFSPVTLGNTGFNSLPVELVKFDATAQKDGVLLEWETAQELNTSHFVLERSANGVDFEEIGEVQAQGNSNNSLSYNYLDAEVNSYREGLFYYRLKSVDLDKSYQYSKVKQVSWDGGATAFEWSSAYPNPFSTNLSIDLAIPIEGEIQYELVDALGRSVRASAKSMPKGQHSIDISDVETLRSGFYLRKVAYEGKSLTKKVVKR